MAIISKAQYIKVEGSFSNKVTFGHSKNKVRENASHAHIWRSVSRLRGMYKDPKIGLGLIIQEQQGDLEQVSKVIE